MHYDLSWVLSGVSCFVLWGIGNKWKWIWFVALFSQSLWFYYIFQKELFGLIPMHVIYTGLYLNNLRKWYRQ